MISIRLLICFIASMILGLLNCTVTNAAAGGMQLEGGNISGAEWAPHQIPGTFMIHYIFPTQSGIDYFASKGMKVIRVPISWERIQPEANGNFDATDLGRLDAVINYASSRGLRTIIDLHNYGAYKNITVGVPGGHPNSVLANFWSQIAQKYKGNSKIIFGIMNEPVGRTMTANTWLATCQASINAIRATGSTNLILVPSTYWGHPVDFIELNSSVMINVHDPANNYSYDVHQYLDYDGSGTHTDVLSPSAAVATLSSFTAWLKAHNRTAFLSEIGVPATPEAQDSLGAMLKYMHANAAQWDGYTYWSAGPWWQNYIFGVEPVNGQDTPQMKTLIANLGGGTTLPGPSPAPYPEPTPAPEPAPPPTSDSPSGKTKKSPPGKARK